MKKGRKELIKRLHADSHPSYKGELEKEFPKLFKEEALVVGKWYKWLGADKGIGILGEKCKFHEDSYKLSYFIGEGLYTSCSSKYLEPATDKEVEQALIKEAKKRGFKKGVRFTCLYNKFIVDDCHPMLCSEGYLWIKGGCVFRDGKWATIIKETITKEQAEKELGKTILN